MTTVVQEYHDEQVRVLEGSLSALAVHVIYDGHDVFIEGTSRANAIRQGRTWVHTYKLFTYRAKGIQPPDEWATIRPIGLVEAQAQAALHRSEVIAAAWRAGAGGAA